MEKNFMLGGAFLSGNGIPFSIFKLYRNCSNVQIFENSYKYKAIL